MKHTLPAAALFLIASIGFASAVRGEEPFEAFLEKHCIVCHGPQNEDGGLRIHQLSRDFKSGADTHHWAEVLDKVNSGEMPPEKELQPTIRTCSGGSAVMKSLGLSELVVWEWSLRPSTQLSTALWLSRCCNLIYPNPERPAHVYVA